MFALIHPELCVSQTEKLGSDLPKNAAKSKILQHCGFEDTIVNHVLLLRSATINKLEQADLERIADKSMLSRRAFNVQCIENMELLSLSFNVID